MTTCELSRFASESSGTLDQRALKVEDRHDYARVDCASRLRQRAGLVVLAVHAAGNLTAARRTSRVSNGPYVDIPFGVTVISAAPATAESPPLSVGRRDRDRRGIALGRPA